MHLSKKEEVKLFADGLMLYIGNPGNSTRKLFELINLSDLTSRRIHREERILWTYTVMIPTLTMNAF